ncbi:cutinase family protein [Candidatus Saccharibacteria bacterium]|nr:cutinase family protein [Candidatus Saccharibacteria bacterium]
MARKYRYKKQSENRRVKWRYLMMMVLMIVTMLFFPSGETEALECPDLRVLFARGSGGARYTSGHYLAFKEAMDSKLKTSGLKYEIDDLDYSAVSIDIREGHLDVLVGAFLSGGEAYEFGESVHEGTAELLRVVNDDKCKETKYVLGGYSQGAIVLLDGLGQIDPDKIVYVATFGDPKIYLPEGAGFVPAACSGKNLSEYRVYVPDCRAYKGILGAREPYVSEGYAGKIGTWCNKFDVLCSSHFSVSSHTSYAEDGLYEDASKLIFSKIGAEFGFKNQYTSPHDTAILIDSTGSMDGLIGEYKAEALNLARKTLENGGRVALYDYRDLVDEYLPVERCNFETCDLASFQAGLNAIKVDGGGDDPESLLSASVQVMRNLNWKLGSTKSLVILTDAGYHSPDLDGTTFYDVQKLSKQIDPVNFYIITTEPQLYQLLAEATGGAAVSVAEDLSLLTDSIMDRYDSLPQVEEEFEDELYDNHLPNIKNVEITEVSETAVKINFEMSGEKTAVFLNDGMIGIVDSTELTIADLRRDAETTISLVPLSADRRGETVTKTLPALAGRGGTSSSEMINNNGMVDDYKSHLVTAVIPKAPNTGVR